MDSGNFPHAVREIENEWIPLADGTRLAARLWLPDDAPTATRCRRSSSTSPTASATAPRPRDELIHPWFAGHGYASLRVDIRGSGESDGVLPDEYLQQEQDDARRGDRLDRRASPGAPARSA